MTKLNRSREGKAPFIWESTSNRRVRQEGLHTQRWTQGVDLVHCLASPGRAVGLEVEITECNCVRYRTDEFESALYLGTRANKVLNASLAFF